MARYSAVIRKEAEAELLAIPFPFRRQLNQLVFKLLENPRLPGSVMVDEGSWRIEAHGWVLVYEVDDEQRVVTIIRFRKSPAATA